MENTEPNMHLFFCFSQYEQKWIKKIKNAREIYKWDGEYIWRDWKNCTISITKLNTNLLLILVRKKNIQYSDYMKKNIEIKFMFNFECCEFSEPQLDYYYYDGDSNKINNNKTSTEEKNKKPIWIVKLKKESEPAEQRKECWLWEWAKDGVDLKNSNLYKLYMFLKDKQNLQFNTFIPDQRILKIETKDSGGKIVPVIYQPSNDSWRNFLRQIHCYKINNDTLEISLVFNNEELRKNRFWDSLYRKIRQILYGRIEDVETFKILLKNKKPINFRFPNIYSGNYTLKFDSVHEDKTWFFKRAPKHGIKLFYSNENHPIVFINTANHAMAEHDNNKNLWKWEYCGWENDSPIVLGNKSREEIDDILKNYSKEKIVEDTKLLLANDNISVDQTDDPIIVKKYECHIRREYLINKYLAQEILNNAFTALK